MVLITEIPADGLGATGVVTEMSDALVVQQAATGAGVAGGLAANPELLPALGLYVLEEAFKALGKPTPKSYHLPKSKVDLATSVVHSLTGVPPAVLVDMIGGTSPVIQKSTQQQHSSITQVAMVRPKNGTGQGRAAVKGRRRAKLLITQGMLNWTKPARKPGTRGYDKLAKAAGVLSSALSSGAASHTVSAPVSSGNVGYLGKARMKSTSSGGLVVCHREILSSVSSNNSAFGSQVFSINPGLYTSFPWTSGIAQLFEEYRIRSMVAIYETAGITSTAGQVYMAFQYDPKDAAPRSIQEVSSFGCSFGPVWQNQSIDYLPRNNLGNLFKYTRTGALQANEDIKLSDAANLAFCTNNVTDATACGTISLEFEIEFRGPIYQEDALYLANSLQVVAGGASIAPSTPLGTVPTSGGGYPFTVSANGDTLTLNRPGNYLMILNMTGTVVNNTLPTLTVTNCAVANTDGPSEGTGQMINAAATTGVSQWRVTNLIAGATIKVDFTASCNTLTTAAYQLAPWSLTS